MADAQKNSVGVVRKGQVIKDQGFVPYNGPLEEATPDVAKATSVSGKTRGMGEAQRGGNFKIC